MNKKYFLQLILSLASMLLVSGCFPWPDGGEDQFVDSTMIDSAKIGVDFYGDMLEADQLDLLFVLNDTSSLDYVELSKPERLEVQMLSPGGTYEQNINAKNIDGQRVSFVNFDTPSSFKVLLHRASGAIEDLLKIKVNAKLVSSISGTDFSYGNGESVEFVWDWVAGDQSITTNHPEIVQSYELECTDEMYTGKLTIPPGDGTPMKPFIVSIDEIISPLPKSALPCIGVFSIRSYPVDELTEPVVIEVDIGATFHNPGPLPRENNSRISIHPKTHRISIR